MAIQGSGTYSASNYVTEHLQLGAAATGIIKRNYNNTLTVAGVAGQVVGHWRAVWVRLPASFAGSARPVLVGYDHAGTGVFTGTLDTALRIPHDSFTTTGIRRRLQLYLSSVTSAYTSTEGDVSVISQFGFGTPTLIVDGVINIGSNASPVWRNFAAVCPTGGTPETYVAPSATTTNWLSGTTGRLFHQIFSSNGAGNARTNPGSAMEHATLVTGDFPWDTANDAISATGVAVGAGRPHHAALQALAGAGANPFLTYRSLIDAMNLGSLPYSNLLANRGQGRANLDYWWPLNTRAAGLTNSGDAGTATLSISAQGTNTFPLEDVTSIAPAHWSPTVTPTVNAPPTRFTGGRGAHAVIRTGTYGGTTTTLQRRWTYDAGAVNLGAVTGAVVGGSGTALDWASTGLTVGGGAWSSSDVLPIGGPYALEVRDAASTANVSIPLADNLVGTSCLFHGQSGIAQSLMGEVDDPPGINRLAVVADAGIQGAIMKLVNERGADSSGSAYVRPTSGYYRIIGGTTPAMGQGAVLLFNEWNTHNPAHPLLIINMPISGISMANYVDNVAMWSTNWKLLGPATPAAPDAVDGANSGVVNYYAWLTTGFIDLHLMDYTTTEFTQARRQSYASAINTRFYNSPTAPWVILPTHRCSRENTTFGAIAYRSRCFDMVDDINALNANTAAPGPYWPDIVMLGTGALHPAYQTDAGSSTINISDQNRVGQARLGMGIGRTTAWFYNRKVKANGPRLVGAWWTDGTGTKIDVECGRQMRTLNSASLAAELWWVTPDGTNWYNGADPTNGFTVAFVTNTTRVRYTKNSGSWAIGGSVKVDFGRDWSFASVAQQAIPLEPTVERSFDGIPYDNQTYRGGSAGLNAVAGNAMQGVNRTASTAGYPDGVAVTVQGNPKLLTTEKFSGTRNVTIRLMASDGVTVLREKTLTITAS